MVILRTPSNITFNDFFKTVPVTAEEGCLKLSIPDREFFDLSPQVQEWFQRNSIGIDVREVRGETAAQIYFENSTFWRPLVPQEAIKTTAGAFLCVLKLFMRQSFSCEGKEAFDLIDALYVGYARVIKPAGNWRYTPSQRFKASFTSSERQLWLTAPPLLQGLLVGRGGRHSKMVEDFLRPTGVRVGINA